MRGERGGGVTSWCKQRREQLRNNIQEYEDMASVATLHLALFLFLASLQSLAKHTHTHTHTHMKVYLCKYWRLERQSPPVFISVDLFCRMAATVLGRRRRELALLEVSCVHGISTQIGAVFCNGRRTWGMDAPYRIGASSIYFPCPPKRGL